MMEEQIKKHLSSKREESKKEYLKYVKNKIANDDIQIESFNSWLAEVLYKKEITVLIIK